MSVRPCANPFCGEQLPEGADRRKRYCDDNTCGREARRIRRNKGNARDVHRAEKFWRGLGAVRPGGRGWTDRQEVQPC